MEQETDAEPRSIEEILSDVSGKYLSGTIREDFARELIEEAYSRGVEDGRERVRDLAG